MPSTTMLCIFFFSLAVSTASPATCDDVTPTVYEVLQEYGFPVGLLPNVVTSYELDRSTGKFTLYLNKTCSFSADDFYLMYNIIITGVISDGRINDLGGVQVTGLDLLFFWLSIREVSVDGDELDFSVGIASEDFSVDNFYEVPRCGCGFDCVKGTLT